MDSLNKSRLDEVTLRKFVGPSLVDSFTNTLGFDESTTKKAVDFYREYYGEKGVYECSFYDGIQELIKSLHNVGIILSVATSKPQNFIDTILEEKRYHDYFNIVSGAGYADDHSDKKAVIMRAICTSNAVMVGDRHYDIEGAKKVGIDSIGVEWGFCHKDEFIKYPPTHIVKKPSDIFDIVVK